MLDIFRVMDEPAVTDDGGERRVSADQLLDEGAGSDPASGHIPRHASLAHGLAGGGEESNPHEAGHEPPSASTAKRSATVYGID